MTSKKIDDIFFQLFCEKNSNGTLHLRLKGNELIHRIHRRLTKDDMYALAKFLRKNPPIISLDLAYNNLTDEGLKILAEEYFERKNKLAYINLMHCDIQAAGMSSLSSAKCVNLKNIILCGNKLGTDGARFIGQLIETCSTLEGIDIGQTDQTLESIESLLMAIEKSNLKFINISRIIPKSCYSQYNNSTLAYDIGVLLKLNTSLKELRAEKCELDGYDVDMLIGGLKVHTNIVLLDLGANRIADHGAILLSMWLGTNPNLMALRLASNEISTPGAQSLALNIPFSKLRLLDIHNNKIGDLGISDILDSLFKPTRMQKLFIWGNKLGKTSFIKLELALKLGVLDQKFIDVKLYMVDGQRCAAYYPTNNYKKQSLSVMEYGVPPELKIIRNRLKDKNNTQPKQLRRLHYNTKFSSIFLNL